MAFRFSRQELRGRDRVVERLLEIVPGATSWSLLIGLTILACWKPRLAAICIIAFDLYWLLRLFYLTIFLVLSYLRLIIERETDWMGRLRTLDTLNRQPDRLRRAVTTPQLGALISHWIYRRQVEPLVRSHAPRPRSSAVHHLVILPVANEPHAVYEAGIRSLTQQTYPLQRMLVVLAVEGRAGRAVEDAARAVQTTYRAQFLDFLVVVHPPDLPGEARVKGANVTHAARAAAQALTARGIPFEDVIVSCFDADTVVSPAYCACLTYHFLIAPDRVRASFQPVPVYHNNIWEVPGFARVLDVGSSFFQLIEATNPEKLVTFSSHSMSFQALVEIGYWPVDMISDDSAIFWKAYLHYEGEYRAIPMYVTVSMDVAAAESWQQTVANVYRQKRRWAWGVENFPIVVRGFLDAQGIPLMKKLKHTLKLFEGHVSWATWPFILGIVGWLPVLCAGREFSGSVAYYTTPRIAGTIFHLATLSLVITMLLSVWLLPRPAVKFPLLKRCAHLVEWLFVPLTAIVMSAIPALDAQTRLLLGRYMEFQVTSKRR